MSEQGLRGNRDRTSQGKGRRGGRYLDRERRGGRGGSTPTDIEYSEEILLDGGVGDVNVGREGDFCAVIEADTEGRVGRRSGGRSVSG